MTAIKKKAENALKSRDIPLFTPPLATPGAIITGLDYFPADPIIFLYLPDFTDTLVGIRG